MAAAIPIGVSAVNFGMAAAVGKMLIDVGSYDDRKINTDVTIVAFCAASLVVMHRRLPVAPVLVGFYGLYVSSNLACALREYNYPALNPGKGQPSVKFSIF